MDIDVEMLIFLTTPPDYLHIKCPICLELLLDDPYLVSCCGQHFCGRCITNPSLLSCPLCGLDGYQKIPDKNHQRALQFLKVHCLHYQEGCTWEGELGKLKSHLSRDGDCRYVMMSCIHRCGVSLAHYLLKEHEEEQCRKRPATCQHCKHYTTTWEDVIFKHQPVCPEEVILCPNTHCDEKFKRILLTDHLAICPMGKVQCEFANVGCKWSGTRNGLANHLDNNLRQHLTFTCLATAHNSEIIQSQQLEIKQLTQTVTRQKTELEKLTKQLQSLNQSSKGATVVSSPPAVKSAAATGASNKGKTKPKIKPHYDFHTVTLSGFRTCKRTNKYMTTGSLYLYPPCQCMELRVFPNGIGKGLFSHVSVFLHIVPGQYDDTLVWPYQGYPVEIRLFDYMKQKSHGKIIFFDSKAALEARSRPHTIIGSKGVGFEQFISNHEVQKYLYKDQLYIEFGYFYDV